MSCRENAGIITSDTGLRFAMTTTPASQTYTFESYLALDAEQRSELVDEALMTKNPPTVEHFLLTKFVEQVLDAEIKRLQHPWLCFREAGVRTNLRRSRLTDVCVVTLDQARELGGAPTVFQTPPLLAVEVVSPVNEGFYDETVLKAPQLLVLNALAKRYNSRPKPIRYQATPQLGSSDRHRPAVHS